MEEKAVEEFKEEILIQDYNVKFFLTKDQYFKKIPLTSLRGSNGHKLKDNDRIIQSFEGGNKEDLLFFTNQHKVYKIKAHELEDVKASTLGEFLPNYLELDEGERILHSLSTFDYSGWMLFFYRNGKAAKIPLKSYETKTNRKKLAKAYNHEEPLIYLTYFIEDHELVAISSIEKVLIFNTEAIGEKSTRHSRGVQVLKPKKGSTLKEVKTLNSVEFEDFNYYRGKVPAIGRFLKKTDKKDHGEQLQIL